MEKPGNVRIHAWWSLTDGRYTYTKKVCFNAEVALMVEHLTCNQGVAGSTPVLGSKGKHTASLF